MSIEEYVKQKQAKRHAEKNKLTRHQRFALIAQGKDPNEVNKVKEVKKPSTRRGARKTN